MYCGKYTLGTVLLEARVVLALHLLVTIFFVVKWVLDRPCCEIVDESEETQRVRSRMLRRTSCGYFSPADDADDDDDAVFLSFRLV